MTSKRMGIVLVALFALWSLAGTGSFVLSSSNTSGDNWFGASLVFAGDPDDYTSSQSTSPDGDPDDYTDPGPQSDDEPQSDSVPDEEDEDTAKTLLDVALAMLLGLGDAIK